MLRSVLQPAASYDLVGLASRGLITVGRETDASIRLDSQDVPFLLSRRHATIQFQPDGRILLKDLNSTNGTYTSRLGQPLRKLPDGLSWDLTEGDTVSFGGPESIIARRTTVANPFIFAYSTLFDAMSADDAARAARAAMRAANDLQVAADQQHQALPDSPSGFHKNTARQLLLESDIISIVSSESDTGHKAQPAAMQDQATARSSNPSTASPSHVMKGILATHFACPICQDWLVACHTLSCGHMFCGPCLISWLNRKQSCPACRKPVAGVPVRCFQVDSTITELLDQCTDIMSPATRGDRCLKLRHWEDAQQVVVPDWAAMLNERKQKASENAARHHRVFMGQAEG